MQTAIRVTAIALAALPDMIRGYGYLKLITIENANRRNARRIALYRSPVESSTKPGSSMRVTGLAPVIRITIQLSTVLGAAFTS